MGVQQGVDGSGDEPAADCFEHLWLPKDGGELLGRRGPCRPPGVLCDGVGRAVCEGVERPVQRAGLEVVPSPVLRVVADALGVSYGDGDGEAGVPSVVSVEEW